MEEESEFKGSQQHAMRMLTILIMKCHTAVELSCQGAPLHCSHSCRGSWLQLAIITVTIIIQHVELGSPR